MSNVNSFITGVPSAHDVIDVPTDVTSANDDPPSSGAPSALGGIDMGTGVTSATVPQLQTATQDSNGITFDLAIDPATDRNDLVSASCISNFVSSQRQTSAKLLTATPSSVNLGLAPADTRFEPSLPFWDEKTSVQATQKPAAPVLKVSSLKETFFVFEQEGKSLVFVDRKLPPAKSIPVEHSRFDRNYFITLSNLVTADGPTWRSGTPNYLGARIKLVHSKLDLCQWRYHLLGYEDAELCQFLEYGFPLGLQDDPPPELVPSLRNHSSSYQFFPWVDEFSSKSVEKCYLSGPHNVQPFPRVHLSPIMTAEKKPSSRRTVFDASFGDHSLNIGTPADLYLGQPVDLVYPRIEDFRALVLKCGRGCYIWKRDLSSFFLQVPLDPVDYPKVAFVWRSAIFFFTGLMFGLRHSGYQGQRVTDAVVWILRRLGLETDVEQSFNALNYSDDIAGVEVSEERALKSSTALKNLLQDLGLIESTSKYHPPSTDMPFLGVRFDTVKLQMSVPPEKLEEVREELNLWSRKSTATKKSMQQLLGKLFWISRCVRFSRPFMGRLLHQLRSMHSQSDHKKTILSDPCKEDIRWWHRYVRRFNGVELIYRDEPLNLSLEQLLDSSAPVICGDAQLWGGGSYFEDE